MSLTQLDVTPEKMVCDRLVIHAVEEAELHEGLPRQVTLNEIIDLGWLQIPVRLADSRLDVT